VSSAPSSAAAVISLLVAMVSFQAGASIAKTLIPLIGAPGTTALRLGISAITMALLQRPWRNVPSRGALPVVLVYGLSLGTMNFVFYMSLRTIPLGIAVGLEFIGPLTLALASSRHRLDVVWIALAAIGLLLLLPIAPANSHLDPAGVLFALGAGGCWALYIVFGQRAGRRQGASASTWGMIIAAIWIVPFGAATAGRTLLARNVLPMGFAVAMLSSAVPYTLEMTALRRLATKTYGTLMSLEPAVAALAGLVLLGERLTILQWLAIGAVIAASIGMLGNETAAAAEVPGAP
jgi:inner membrane transporter RhtA